YLAGGMPVGAVFGPEGPCGPRYLRYLLFLQMWLPSDNWALWNNRSALWTMSAFAFFYLLAPWLYRLLAGAGRRWRYGGTAAGFCLLAAVLAGKGMLGRALEQTLGRLPAGQVDNISQFSAQNPVMELYVFLYGALLFFAVREGQALAFGGFCLLLPLLTGFTRVAFEGVFAALVLLAVCLPCPLRPESRAGRALVFQRRQLFPVSGPSAAAEPAARPAGRVGGGAVGGLAGGAGPLPGGVLSCVRAVHPPVRSPVCRAVVYSRRSGASSRSRPQPRQPQRVSSPPVVRMARQPSPVMDQDATSGFSPLDIQKGRTPPSCQRYRKMCWLYRVSRPVCQNGR